MTNFEPTTDDGDDWVEPDINKRFGVTERPGPGCFVAIVTLVALAALTYFVLRGL